VNILLAQPFSYHRIGNVLRIRGTLLAEGKWSGLDRATVFYPRDVIFEAIETIVGKPIKWGHSDRAEAVVGFVTAAGYTNGSASFEGIVFDSEAIEEIEAGTLTGISMEGLVSTERRDTDIVATSLTFQAAALVESPACDVCRIQTTVPVWLQGEKVEEEKVAEEFWAKVESQLKDAGIPEDLIPKIIDALKKVIKVPYPYPQPRRQEDEPQESDVEPNIVDLLPEEVTSLVTELAKPTRREFLNWLRRQFKEAGLEPDVIRKVMAIIKKAVKTPYPYPYPAPKRQEELEKVISEKEDEIKRLSEEVETFRKTALERVINEIRVIDEEFDAEEFLSDVKCYDLKMRMLEKHLETLRKYVKQKVSLQVDTESDVVAKAKKFVEEIGIDLEEFLESR